MSESNINIYTKYYLIFGTDRNFRKLNNFNETWLTVVIDDLIISEGFNLILIINLDPTI